MRDDYRIYDPSAIYFITSTIVEWVPVFTSKPYFDILVDSIQYCRLEKGLKVFVYVLMENHFHVIFQGEHLSRTLQSLKRHTSMKILEQLKTDGKDWVLNLFQFYKKRHKKSSRHQVWQEGFHPKQIISDDVFRQKAEYIHQNPVRRGYVDLPEHWHYSSAAQVLGIKKGPIDLDPIPF